MCGMPNSKAIRTALRHTFCWVKQPKCIWKQNEDDYVNCDPAHECDQSSSWLLQMLLLIFFHVSRLSHCPCVGEEILFRMHWRQQCKTRNCRRPLGQARKPKQMCRVCVAMMMSVCLCVREYVLEANQRHPWQAMRHARHLDKHNYGQRHDAHGRWDKHESHDICVEYMCQWSCVYVNVIEYMYAYVCVHVSVLGMCMCTLYGLTDHDS